MRNVKIAAAVLNQTPLAWEENLRNVLETIAAAKRERVSILVLPELAITGYGCEDAFLAPGVQERAWRSLERIAAATRGIVVAVGLPVSWRGALFDCAALVADGRVLGLAAKRFLAGDGVHYEPRWFRSWPEARVGDVRGVPIGDLVFDVGGVRIGFEICEDAWVADRPGASLALDGVDVVLNPSASHFSFGKHEVRKRFVLEGARAFGVTYAYANLLGNEAGRALYDGGALIATPSGLVAAGPRFSFAPWRLTTATVDLDSVRAARARAASFRPSFEPLGERLVAAPHAFPGLEPEPVRLDVPAWERGPFRKEEELARAVALGLYDYARKTRATGFVVSSSGGADSAAASVLAALARRLARDELGPRALEPALTCVWQGTANSSPAARASARAVAKGLGAKLVELDVEPLVRGYRALAESAVGRALAWETDDIALQNIQARARGPSVWAIANVTGALLLATGNRSESAVGYATMDGDTCGGLAPIAGVDKTFLREWLRWMERAGPEGVGPVPELAAVNALLPSAELRPPEAAQTDEQDLMPYDVLDAIEKHAVRDKRMPLETWRALVPSFPGHAPETLAAWVERFYRLWARNQWKRERYAPSFHLDDEDLDPRAWCRFPILSGGFDDELDELRAAVMGDAGRRAG